MCLCYLRTFFEKYFAYNRTFLRYFRCAWIFAFYNSCFWALRFSTATLSYHCYYCYKELLFFFCLRETTHNRLITSKMRFTGSWSVRPPPPRRSGPRVPSADFVECFAMFTLFWTVAVVQRITDDKQNGLIGTKTRIFSTLNNVVVTYRPKVKTTIESTILSIKELCEWLACKQPKKKKKPLSELGN